MINHLNRRICVCLFFSLSILTGCGGSGSTAREPELSLTHTTAQELSTLTSIKIPVAGNSWIANDIEASNSMIGDQGLQSWKNTEHELITFVYLENTGNLHLSIDTKVASGTTTLEVEVADSTKLLTLTNTEQKTIYVDEFTIDEPGYQRIIIRGIDHTAETIADIEFVNIGGNASNGKIYYVKDDFYWGRRGPSVHLNYQVPDENADYQWFYTELEVPKGQDALGSYFMANGFAQGYMGIQVNSPTERRVLFSVWSPYQTDDPSEIPEEDRIQLLKKGKNVTTGKFGNEGSGGQSYLVYDWQPDTRYRFLLQVKPADIEQHSDYTAYFYAPESEKWQLIASFRRPKTTTYVARPHAFLENFITGAGQFERKGYYGNQWLRTEGGEWHAITQASFSYDATADKKARLDFQGGEENGEFFLRNTGFFTGPTSYGTVFTRQASAVPSIDLDMINAL